MQKEKVEEKGLKTEWLKIEWLCRMEGLRQGFSCEIGRLHKKETEFLYAITSVLFVKTVKMD